MSVLWIDSNEKGAGKTSVCTAFAQIARSQGISVDIVNLDKSSVDSTIRNASKTESIAKICADIRLNANGSDVIMVESDDSLSLKESGQIVESLDAKVLLIVPYNHARGVTDLMEFQGTFSGKIAGTIVNGVSRFASHDVIMRLVPELRTARLNPIGSIPEDRLLLSVTVDQLTQKLHGRVVVNSPKNDNLVEHFMVGGYGMDPGELTFGLLDNKAVIVRGDRPDVQMSALSTSTLCLVLTNGIDPIEYVKYEAEQEQTSIIVVENGTISTMDALGFIMDDVICDHRDKADRLVDLVKTNLDIEMVWQSLGVC